MTEAMGAFTAAAMRDEPRLALLVDGENLPHAFAEQILARAAAHGALPVRRVYGNMTRLAAWEAAPGFRPVHTGTGKNSADMMLVIEAMALVHAGGLDGVAIASSDRDFTHLAHHLRERGLIVIGIGTAFAPEAFRKACTRFIELRPQATVVPRDDTAPPFAAAPATPQPAPTLVPASATAAAARVPVAAPRPSPAATMRVAQAAPGGARLCDTVRTLIAQEGTGGAMPIHLLGARMAAAHGVTLADTGHKTWRAFLLAHPAQFACDPRGPRACARLR
ncbi:MAG: NYN domain-containing protein [Gemmobacter sp.]